MMSRFLVDSCTGAHVRSECTGPERALQVGALKQSYFDGLFLIFTPPGAATGTQAASKVCLRICYKAENGQ